MVVFVVDIAPLPDYVRIMLLANIKVARKAEWLCRPNFTDMPVL